jgi:hypothetical protein
LQQQQGAVNKMAQENAENKADLEQLKKQHDINQTNLRQVEQQRIVLCNDLKVLFNEVHKSKEMAEQSFQSWQQERKAVLAAQQQLQNANISIRDMKNDTVQMGQAISKEVETISLHQATLVKRQEEKQKQDEYSMQQEAYRSCLIANEAFSIPALMYVDAFKDKNYQPIQVTQGEVMEILFKHANDDKLISIKISQTRAEGTGWLEELDMTKAFNESEGWEFWQDFKTQMSDNYKVKYESASCEVTPKPPRGKVTATNKTIIDSIVNQYQQEKLNH